jgi:hypothetical protein
MYFSYWILVWSILYKLGCIEYNPYITLVGAFIFSLMLLIIYIIKKINYKYILFFILITVIPKLMLILYIQNKDWYEGIQYSFFLFIIYNVWLFLNKTNVFDLYYTNLIKNIQNRDYSKTPIKYLMN